MSENVKRGRGRPRKTEKDKLRDKAMRRYNEIVGKEDRALKLIPEELFYTSQDRGAVQRVMDKLVLNRLLAAKRVGMPDIKAAEYAGITGQSLYKWKNVGRDELANREAGNAPNPNLDAYYYFYIAYVDASYAPMMGALQVIDESIEVDRDVNTARWRTERLIDETYSPSRRVTVGGDGGGAIKVTHVLELPEQRLNMLSDGMIIDIPALEAGDDD